MKRPNLGRQGEDLALTHLTARGYQVLHRNWRCPDGELDLVLMDGETLVFVEVKARRGTDFGAPEDAITPAKRRHLVRSAKAYLEAHAKACAAWRFDVIAIDCRPSGAVLRLEHYRDVIDDEAAYAE